MFDLVAGNTERPLREQSVVARLIAAPVYAIAIGLLLLLPVIGATKHLPDVPTVLAFVAAPVEAPPPPPPPPPPPAPMPPAATKRDESPRHDNELAVPVEAPVTLPTEPVETSLAPASVSGGAESGLAGGVGGGIIGGLVAATPAPPPSPVPPPLPPPPPPTAPVRVGGQIRVPTLEKRVEPTYPAVARAAQLTDVVILEAEVGVDGGVKAVKILRSRRTVLDQAAEEALLQWRYSPLVLNGIPTSFLVTVTFNFSLQSSGRAGR